MTVGPGHPKIVTGQFPFRELPDSSSDGETTFYVYDGQGSLGCCTGIGHQTDLDTGLVYMRARYYDPSAGRFISEDPGQNGTNWYAYCGNNPVNAVDRSGKSGVSVDAVINWAADMGGWTMAEAYLATLTAVLAALSIWETKLAADMYVSSLATQSRFLTLRAGMLAHDALVLGLSSIFVGAAAYICGKLGGLLDDSEAAGYVADYLTSAGSLAGDLFD